MKKTIWTLEHDWLCKHLKEIREGRGLTQKNVADNLDRPQSFVSKYESGDRRLDLAELRDVCLALGISLSEVVERFEKGYPK